MANNTYLKRGAFADLVGMSLHGNRIATFTKDYIKLSSAGWHTRTTKDRLNLALSMAKVKGIVYQHDWVWYICNKNHLTYYDVVLFDGIRINYEGEVIQ